MKTASNWLDYALDEMGACGWFANGHFYFSEWLVPPEAVPVWKDGGEAFPLPPDWVFNYRYRIFYRWHNNEWLSVFNSNGRWYARKNKTELVFDSAPEAFRAAQRWIICDGKSDEPQQTDDKLQALRQEIQNLRNEVDCRIGYGAKSRGHL